MYCTKCGNKLGNNDKFCIKCGKKVDIKKDVRKPVNKKKIIFIVLIIIAIPFLGYCGLYLFVMFIQNLVDSVKYRGKIHEYNDFINYVDNLKCDINNKEYSCNLKDKYVVISDENGVDKNNRKLRRLYFRVNNSDLEFWVESSYQCVDNLDGSCLKYQYELTDRFHLMAFNHYLSKYNQLVGYNDNYCYSIGDDDCSSTVFLVKTNNDLDYLANYMEGFLNYINSLDFKFIDKYENFGIYVKNDDFSDEKDKFYVAFDIINDKYVYRYRDDCIPSDGNISTYINECIKK